MDPSDFPPGKSPRKELQGPRPAPLKIHKDSHKIRKPPVAPQPSQPPPYPPRQPIIIYTVSPKIIHTNPSEFMDLVQRLTGNLSSVTEGATTTSNRSTMTSSVSTSMNSTITTTTNPNLYGSHVSSSGGGVISPAARYATIEKARSPQGKLKSGNHNKNNGNDPFHPQLQYYGGISSSNSSISHGLESGMEIDPDNHDDHYGVESTANKGFFSGILSPGPASLPPIHPNFFSPPSDNFFHDLSPVLHGNRNFNIDQGSFMPSPASNYFVSPRITSPNTPSIDFLFNNIFSDNNL